MSNSSNQSDKTNNQHDSLENVAGTENFMPVEENSLDSNHNYEDFSGIRNDIQLSRSSTPNELEKTFEASENLVLEQNCRYAFAERTEQNIYSKTKPMDVLRKTKAHEVASESSPDSDITEQLKCMSVKPESRREQKPTKTEKNSATNFDHRRRQISDDQMFKFDEDLERERKMAAENNENAAAENLVKVSDEYEPFRCRNLKLFSDFDARLRGLNELLMAAESLRKFMVHMRSQEDYKGEKLPERDIVRKSSLNALTSDKNNRFQFENLDKGMRITWNKAISSIEDFLKKSMGLIRMYRQKSPEFCIQNIKYYLEYARVFREDLGFMRDLIQFRYDNLPRDRAIDICLANLCNLMSNFDKIYKIETYLLQLMCTMPKYF